MIALLFLVLSAAAIAQDGELITTKAVEAQMEEVSRSNSPPQVQEEALAIWEETRSQASKLRAARTRIDSFENGLQEAPDELARTKAALGKVQAITSEETLAPLSASEVKIQRAAIETELLTKQSQLNTLLAESQKRADRLAVIPADILALANERPAPPADLEAEAAVAEAWAEFQKVRNPDFLNERLKAMELEQKFYAATEELHTLRKQLLQQDIAHLQKELKTYQLVSDRKTAQEKITARETAQAQVEQFAGIPVLSDIAAGNAQLAQEREKVSRLLTAAQQLHEVTIEQLAKIRSESENARNRITLLQAAEIEIDAETGRLLRQERAELPTIASLRLRMREALRTSTQSQLAAAELERRIINEHGDLDAKTKQLQEDIGEITNISSIDIRELLQKRRSLESSLAEDYRNYYSQLEATTGKTQELADEVRRYSLYLDERLLWIASASRLHTSDFAVERAALEKLIGNDFAKVWLPELITSLRTKTIAWVASFLTVAFLLSRRRHYRQILKTTAEQASRKSCSSFRPTWKALLHTILLALPLSLALLALSWLVPSPSHIVTAFTISALFVFLLATFRRMASRHGLFCNHFQMSEAHGKLLHRHLTWLLLTAPVTFFLFFALSGSIAGPQAGRFFFIGAMLLLITFVHATLRPKLGLIPIPHRFKKLPHILYLVALTIPILFIIGSSFGYISSVDTLRRQTMISVWLILISVLVVRLLERWILVSRRELARTRALKTYQARLATIEKEKKRKKKSPGSEDPEPLPSVEEEELKAINIVTVEDQTKKLVRVAITTLLAFGILNIWASSLQALSFLDRISLWGGTESSVIETIGTQSGFSSLGLTPPAASAEGPTAPESPGTFIAKDPGLPRESGVSLQDLAIAILTVVLTILAAKNLPGLLELSLLRRLDLKPGGNYAVTTILRYAISAIGLLIAFGLIGVTWSSVQWLAAAITLGIGFGLQEIFANFVAGIILLFERPIRVGDVVTVGEVSGGVTKIEMRATTIRQFNSRELIVPNKEFITGQLVNWTLSDDVLRFDVLVGVAYGSDTQAVSDLLVQIAQDNARVLESPAPQILLTAFGASTLDFTLRAFISGVGDLVPCQSELHFAIDREFRKAGIEIAFPQTDIHIRSVPEKGDSTLTPSPTNPAPTASST